MKIKLICLVLVAATVTGISTKRIQLIDITPEEAQKLITEQSLDLRYATKLSERASDGRDGDDYVEETYEANQFHGQDGLGRAIFGYTDNQQSRLEARNVNGEVRGQYQYLDPWGNDVQVQYWSDGLGFHQTDNHPSYELKPVTETPDVRKAREEHERLWKEAARLNGVDPDANDYISNVDRFESEADESDDDDGEEELEGQVSNQHQSLIRYPALPYSGHIVPSNARSFGRVVDDAVIVDSAKSGSEQPVVRFARQNEVVEEEDEVASEPRGFFYSFDYPVPFLKRASSAAASERYETRVHVDEQQPLPLEVHDAQKRPSVIAASESRVQPRKVLAVEVNDMSKSEQRETLVKQQPAAVIAAPSAKKPVKKTIASSRGSIKFKSNANL